MLRTKPFSLLLLLLIPVSYCIASDDDLFELSLEELMVVPISGVTLLESQLTHSPSAVTVFSRDQIRRLGVDYVEELMNLVPGFQRYRVSQTPINYVYSSRGRRIAEGAYDVLILLDGLPLRSPRTGGNANSHSLIPLLNVERVEFIRGPGSAIYGSNAMMGVINIVTTRYQEELFLQIGSFDHHRAAVTATGSAGDFVWNGALQINQDEGDAFQLRDAYTVNAITESDPREQLNAWFTVVWENGLLKLRHNRNEGEGFYILSNLAEDINYSQTRLSQLAISQSWQNTYVNSDIELRLNRDSNTASFQLLPAGALFAVSQPQSSAALRGVFRLESAETALHWSQQWHINVGHLISGVEWRESETTWARSNNNFDLAALVLRQFPIASSADNVFVTPVELLTSQFNIAAYVQYQVELNTATDITLGLRHDSYHGNESRTSPRLALVYQLNDHHWLKTLYGEAFRAAGLAETGLINNPVARGNPDLLPETVNTRELIWLAHYPDLWWHLGYFDNRFDNAIVLSPTGQGQLLQYQNRSQSPSRGYEFELSQQINTQLLWRATAMHLTMQPEDGWREAATMYSLLVNWHQDKWNASLTAVHHGAREMIASNNINNRVLLDPYWQLDGKWLFAFDKNIDLFIQGNNLLNEPYSSPPQVSTLPEGIPDRGRQWQIGLNYRYGL